MICSISFFLSCQFIGKIFSCVFNACVCVCACVSHIHDIKFPHVKKSLSKTLPAFTALPRSLHWLIYIFRCHLCYIFMHISCFIQSPLHFFQYFQRFFPPPPAYSMCSSSQHFIRQTYTFPALRLYPSSTFLFFSRCLFLSLSLCCYFH